MHLPMFIINRIRRYDIQGKEVLQTNEKYYLGDVSLAYAAFGFKDRRDVLRHPGKALRLVRNPCKQCRIGAGVDCQNLRIRV